jgi:hypothetical protein
MEALMTELLKGNGDIFEASKKLCRSKYIIEISTLKIEAGTMGITKYDLVKVPSARIEPIGCSIFELMNKKQLTLELKDHRKIDFSVTNCRTGNIAICSEL